MIIRKHDKNNLLIGCDDKELLEAMKQRMSGQKVRMKNQIIIPNKSGPKIYRFADKGNITWHGNTEQIVQRVAANLTKRKANIIKIKSEYGNTIKFDYNCRGKYEPMEHQKIMYNIMAYCDVGAILAEPGTCKTGPYLWAIDERIRRGQIKKALVITLPQLKKNVVAEMSVQTPHLKGFVLGNKTQADKILNKKYKSEKKNIDYDVYVSNYESMFSLVELFEEGFFDMVILDEAHRVGSPKSRQTKSIVDKFENVPYKYIITGTLSANNLMSFFMPFRFMGPDTVPYANYYEFRRTYMMTVDPDGHIWRPLPGSVNMVKKIIGNLSVTFTKEECINLPPIGYQVLSCDMGPGQSKLYEQMKKDFVIEIDNMCAKCDKKGCCDNSCETELVAKNALVMKQKLRQISCGFYINTRVTVDKDGKETKASNTIFLEENPKLDLLIQTLNNIPDGRQVIIWSDYISSIEMIVERIKKAFGEDQVLTCYRDQDAFDQVELFRTTGKRFMVANPSKMGVGLNVQFSWYQVFFNSSESWIERDQAEGRQHRKGQENKVTVIDLVCEKSVDKLILQTLKKKEALSITLSELARVMKEGFD